MKHFCTTLTDYSTKCQPFNARQATQNRSKGEYLEVKLAQHLILCVFMVEMAQVDKGFMHGLIPGQGISVLHGLTDNITILVLNDNHLQLKDFAQACARASLWYMKPSTSFKSQPNEGVGLQGALSLLCKNPWKKFLLEYTEQKHDSTGNLKIAYAIYLPPIALSTKEMAHCKKHSSIHDLSVKNLEASLQAC